MRQSLSGSQILTPRASVSTKKARTDESRIKVVIRKRPLDERNASSIIEVHPQLAGASACLTVHEPKLKVDLTSYTEEHKFRYDAIFDDTSSNKKVYGDTAMPLIKRFVATGARSTCFAYGATGAGKTYTMLGSLEEPGVMVNTLHNMFQDIRSAKFAEAKFKVTLSYMEIYNELIKDLLQPTSVDLKLNEDPARGMVVQV